MSKGIAKACSECTAKQENKASYSTYYVVLDLIDFFGDDRKCRLKKETFIIVKKIVLTKNWFDFSNFWEFPKYHTENNVLAICISYKKPVLNSLLSGLSSYRVLKRS